MDVEKTIEFILSMQAKAEARVEIDNAEFRERQARLDEQLAKLASEHAKTNALLRRAIRAGVEEARHERVRRQELDARVKELDARFDEKMSQLSAAQLVTEEKLQGLIESLRRGGNGHGA